MSCTLSDAGKILRSFENVDLTGEALTRLLQSGLLDDLLVAAKLRDLRGIDSYCYQRSLGMKPDCFRVFLGGPKSTDCIIKDAGLLISDRAISQRNFPIIPTDSLVPVQIRLIDPGRDVSRGEGMAMLKKFGLQLPTHEHAIRFAEQCGAVMPDQPRARIAFLQACRADETVYRHLCVCREAGGIALRMSSLDTDFPADYMLAGVKPGE